MRYDYWREASMSYASMKCDFVCKVFGIFGT